MRKATPRGLLEQLPGAVRVKGVHGAAPLPGLGEEEALEGLGAVELHPGRVRVAVEEHLATPPTTSATQNRR